MGLLRALLSVGCVHALVVLGVLFYEMWILTRSNLKYKPAQEDASLTMQAAQFSKFGNVSVIELVEIPRPACCNAGHVLVKVVAGALNPVDFKQRRMEAPAMMRPLPSVSGFDFSGVIEQVSPDVTDFVVGDAVFGMLPLLGQRWGAFQEFIVVDASIIAKAPRETSLKNSAALPLVSLTVLHALAPVVKEWRRKGESPQGKHILIHAGAGGVGSFAIQYCKNVLGMRVTTTASSANTDFVKALGAEQVIDYRAVKFEDVVKAQDAILDTVTQEYEARTFANPSVLKQDGIGHYIHVLSTDWQPNSRESNPVNMMLPLLKKWGYTLLAKLGFGVSYHCDPVSPDGAGLQQIAAWVDEGLVKPVVDRSFSLAQTAQAHLYLETGKARGKVIVDVSPST
eukprot:TRINITY_DN19148_c0_g1_i1.p1 TRINITY_DN19148_c0_g1~~TRINITY_DN19148_c0_g1_i1.p1  ORF type:complete len:397 (+),score=49.72 TRINITY_DN19148_c0_g1_i1:52-1242(+)